MKKYKLFVLSNVLFVMVSVFSMHAEAALQNLGVDSLGNRLIYDSDLDITWYDYSNATNTWQNQVDWADGLSVNFGGNIYDNWRLPTTVDGLYDLGYDGTTTGGYNITTSEMGHLFYMGIGNTGPYDTSGNRTDCSSSSPWCLTNTGDFQNLQPNIYWSDTEYAANANISWYFSFSHGFQRINNESYNYNALAVSPGLAVVPEPVSSTLFIVGGATLGFRRFRKKFKK